MRRHKGHKPANFMVLACAVVVLLCVTLGRQPKHEAIVVVRVLTPATVDASQNIQCANYSTWTASCPDAGHARVSIDAGSRAVHWGPFTSDLWGNALSPYWTGRALADLAGYQFDAGGGFSGSSWLTRLPKTAKGTGCARPAAFAAACASCVGDSHVYSHRCPGVWQHLAPTIAAETRAALDDWIVANNLTQDVPVFGPQDVVIQSRCSGMTVLDHEEYGPAGFSFYRHIPKVKARASTQRRAIHIIGDPKQRDAICQAILSALIEHLQKQHPTSDVQLVSGERHVDFLRLVHAPILFREAGSSFGLWAGLANADRGTGAVWSTPFLDKFAGNNTTPDLGLGEHWRWETETPVLYPELGKSLNLTREHVSQIIEWLRTN